MSFQKHGSNIACFLEPEAFTALLFYKDNQKEHFEHSSICPIRVLVKRNLILVK